MRCPTCGRHTPDALIICKHCGASTRTSLWRRLFGWVSRPKHNVSFGARTGLGAADDEPLGIEMPAAGAKAVTFSVGRVATELSVSTSPVDSGEAGGVACVSGGIPPELLRQLREAAGPSGELRYHRIERDDGPGDVTVTESGTPLDPQVRAAIQKLLASESVAREQQIVIETNGNRQVFDSIDDVPSHLRKFLGPFADAPIDPTAATS